MPTSPPARVVGTYIKSNLRSVWGPAWAKNRWKKKTTTVFHDRIMNYEVQDFPRCYLEPLQRMELLCQTLLIQQDIYFSPSFALSQFSRKWPRMVKISNRYTVLPSSVPQKVLVEHSALLNPSNHWFLEVKYKSSLNTWESLDHAVDTDIGINGILVSLPPLKEELEIAAFGNPGEKDMKRKQIGIFGPNPVKGMNWIISIFLFDETSVAFKVISICKIA